MIALIAANAAPTTSNPLLAELQDIHLPEEAISWYPLAPGYYLVGVLLFLAIIGLVMFWRRKQLQYLALIELKQQIVALPFDGHNYLNELNVLVKRGFLSYYPRTAIAGLAETDWLAVQSLALSEAEAQQLRALYQQRFSAHALDEAQMQQLQTLALKVVSYALPFQAQVQQQLMQEATC